ncbi:MAG: hypothetical protein JRJ29_15215 [Deltaproteobacteria bacterium]|nr:hypothetical protein [Deltaproteobacteria bacterium]
MLGPSTIIIPALPLHLAFEWLERDLAEKYTPERIEIPEAAKASLPYAWQGKHMSLLASYADFLCPEDCPEPPEHCTVTGEKRAKTLYELLNGLEIPGYYIHVVKSRQMGPGVGGYRVMELKRLKDNILSAGRGKWIIATACKCHGVLSAMELKPR